MLDVDMCIYITSSTMKQDLTFPNQKERFFFNFEKLHSAVQLIN